VNVNVNVNVNRRELLKMTGAAALLAPVALASDPPRQVNLPAEVAGVALPRSGVAVGAAAFAQQRCPEFLFNHCMRTFIFGALLLRRRQLAFHAEPAFVASALHDLGLLPGFESPHGSFEIDGADAAEKFMLEHHRSAAESDQVWHAVEMHDGKWALTARQGPEAMLVALGAGADVYGPDPGDLEARQIAEVLTAFPRQQFKQRFTSLLIAHCDRKPNSQRGTWLEGVCRRHVPSLEDDSVEQRIAAADFAE
jgi:HD domain